MNLFELAAKITLDTSEFKKGLDNAKNMATNIGNGFVTLGKAGVAAVGAATAAVGVLAKASVDAGMSFDKSMSQVAATMGLSMDEMKNEVGTVDLAWGKFSGNLREYAQEMGRNTAFSATQAADALNYMALAGYDVQTSMDMLPNVLNLAAAGNMDLARASDMVTDAATAFGLVLEDGTVDIQRTTQMVDEMAKAASTGNTSVEQLGDAFLVVGGLAKELNGGMITLKDGTTSSVNGIEELEIALTAMANAGVKGSEAGTHMRNMLLKLSSPTKEGAKQFEALGVNVFDAEGKMRSLSDIFGDLDGALSKLTQEQKIQAISDLFNTRDMASAEALLGAVGQDWDKIGESILNAEGAAQKMADTQLDNLAGDITLFKSALEGAEIAISDVLTAEGNADQGLRSFVRFGTDGISRLTSAFKEGGLTGAMQEFGNVLSEGVTMITQKAPMMVDAGIKLLGALGKGIVDSAPVIFSAMEQIGGMMFDAAIELGNKVLLGIANTDWNQAGITIAEKLSSAIQSLSMLASIGVSIVENLMRGMTKAAPAIMASAAQSIKDNFLSGLALEDATGFVGAALGLVEAIARGIGESAPEMIPAAVQFVADFAQYLINQIPQLVNAGIDLATGLTKGIGNPANITSIINVAIKLVMTLLKTLVSNGPRLIDAGMNLLANVTKGLMDSLPSLIEKAPEIIAKLLEAVISNAPKMTAGGIKLIFVLINGIIQATPSILKAFVELIPQLLGAFIRAVPQLITAGIEAVKNVIDGISQMIPNLVLMAPQLIAEFISGLVAEYHQLVQSGSEMIEEIKSGILDKIDDAKEWGKDLMRNFISGIKQKISDLRDAVSSAAEIVSSHLHFSEPDEGPLKNFHTYAPDMMKLFAQGIRDNEDLVARQMEKSFALPDISQEIGMTGASSGSGSSVGNIYITVNGAEGQSEERLAEIVSNRLLHEMGMKQAVSYAVT